MTTVATAFLLFGSMDTVTAHPGHGAVSSSSGVWHYLTSPLHISPVLILLSIILGCLWVATRLLNDKAER